MSGDGPALTRNKHDAARGVTVDISFKFGFKVLTYTFEVFQGPSVHVVSNASMNREPGGPDDMFTAMRRQEEEGMDLHLECQRFAASTAGPKLLHGQVAPRSSGCANGSTTRRGSHEKHDSMAEEGNLMTAFPVNYGMPYEFVACGGSLPFDAAPRTIPASRASLNRVLPCALIPRPHTEKAVSH